MPGTVDACVLVRLHIENMILETIECSPSAKSGRRSHATDRQMAALLVNLSFFIEKNKSLLKHLGVCVCVCFVLLTSVASI